MHGLMLFSCLLLTGLKFQEEAFEVDAVRKLRLQLKRDPCEIQLNINFKLGVSRVIEAYREKSC